MPGKSSNADKAYHIRLVAEKILDVRCLPKAQRTAEILRYTSDLVDCTERQAETYVKWATEHLANSGDKTKDERVVEAEGRLDRIFAQCEDEKDRRTAVAAIQEKSKLFGLHEPQKITQKVVIVGAVVLHDMAGEFDDSVKKRKGKKK